MATQWCVRMLHFFEIWVLQEDSGYMYTAADLESFRPSDEWLNFCGQLELGSAIQVRCNQVDVLRPTNPMVDGHGVSE